MPRLTLIIAGLLIAFGLGFYVGTSMKSATALIPLIPGLLLLVCGSLALKDRLRRHAIHAAMVFALLGLGASVLGMVGLVKLLAGVEVDRPAAAVEASVMGLICLTYILLGIRSFIAARNARR